MSWVDSVREKVRSFTHSALTPENIQAMLEGDVAITDPDRLFAGFDSTPYNPSELVTKQGLEIFDIMRRDDQVKASLIFKKQSVLSTEWTITSPKDQPDDWEVSRFVKWTLNNMEKPFKQTLFSMLSALDYGYSIGEKIWEQRDTPFGNKIIMKVIRPKHPRGFDFRADEFGNLITLHHWTGQDFIELNPGKFVIYSYAEEFDNYYGESDLIAAHRSWWVKENAYKWMAMGLERLGVPPIFILYDPISYSSTQKADLKTILTNMQASTNGIMPRPIRQGQKGEDVLDFWTPEIASQINNVFVPIIDMLNVDIARSILMPEQIGFTPAGGRGSFSKSSQHFDAYLLVIEFLRDMIEENVQRQIIDPLTVLNFGNIEETPRFKFLPITDGTRLKILESWVRLIEKGSVTPTEDDETHVRSMLRFPKSGGVPLRQPEDNQEDDAPNAQSENDEEEEAIGDMSSSHLPVSMFITKTRAKELNDGHDSIEDETKEKLIPLLEIARDAMSKFVTNNDDKSLVSKIDTLKLKGVPEMGLIIKEFLRTAFAFGQETMRKDILQAEKEAKFAVTKVGLTPQAAIQWLDKWEKFEVTASLRDDILQDAKAIILGALKNGEPREETVAKLEKVFEPYVGDPTVLRDGLPISPSKLNTIVKTNMTTAFNQGRLVEGRRLGKLMQGFRYSAILDARTTEQCELLNDKIFRIDDPDLDSLTPSNHFSCRSLLVPVTISQKIKEDEFVTSSEKGKASGLIPQGFGGSAEK